MDGVTVDWVPFIGNNSERAGNINFNITHEFEAGASQ
jgi:hypothetical protein